MPVLTNFLSVQEISEKEASLAQELVNELNGKRNAFSIFSEAFDFKITPSSEIGRNLIQEEKETLVKLFNATNSIPRELRYSFFGTCFTYMEYFDKLSRYYPITNVFQLKKIADALSFVILPIEYVDIDKIFEMYYMQDAFDKNGYGINVPDNLYYNRIRNAYYGFKRIIESAVKEEIIKPQNFYILAPISFYDFWLEVSSKKIIPKYFSSKLFSLSTTIGIMLPAQRNLFKMIKNNTHNISEMKETMEANFDMLKQSIEDCHSRIEWVERAVNRIEEKLASQKIQLREIQLKQQKIETMLYCLLDPIIFALDADIDISKRDANDAKARIGLCFGPEMPIDFFVENGLTTIRDKRFDKVTEIFHPKNIDLS